MWHVVVFLVFVLIVGFSAKWLQKHKDDFK